MIQSDQWVEQWVLYGWALMLITIALQSCFHAISEAQVAEHRELPSPPLFGRLFKAVLRVTLSVAAGLALGWGLSFYSEAITDVLTIVQENLPPFVTDPEDLSPPHLFVQEMAFWMEGNPIRGWASASIAFLTSIYVYRKPRKLEDHHARHRYLLAIWGVNVVFALAVVENLHVLLPWFIIPALAAKALMYSLRIVDVWPHAEPTDWLFREKDNIIMLGLAGLVYGIGYLWLARYSWGLNINHWSALVGLGAVYGLPLVFVAARMQSFLQGALAGLVLSVLYVAVVLLGTGTPPAMLIDAAYLEHVSAPLVVIAPGMVIGGAFFAVTSHR